MNATRICSIDGCGKRHKARGVCNTHYARIRSVETRQPDYVVKHHDAWAEAAKPLETRLVERRRITERGCWEWTGAVTGHGYGRMSWNNHVERTHRLAAVCWMGFDLESDQVVRHKCDNPPCFNPEHLEFGTQHDNVLDMHERGRARNGAKLADFCRRGHPMQGENIKYGYKGSRRCRTCDNAGQRKRRNDPSRRVQCGECGKRMHQEWVKSHQAIYHPAVALGLNEGENDEV